MTSSSVVHSFRDQLEYSTNLSDETAWWEFYQRLWPDLVACVRVDRDGQGQRDGIDRVIHLANGKSFSIDEKKRKKDYGDVLLEDWSVWYSANDRRNKIGWALDPTKRCDFVAYAIPVAAKCYFLPFELLRQAFKLHLGEWERLHPPMGRRPDTPNNGYVTRNIAVPWADLKVAIAKQMHRRFGGNELHLPTPFTVGEQTVFAWEP